MSEQVANAEPATTEVAGGQTAPVTTTTQTAAAEPEKLSLDDQLSAVYDREQAKIAEQNQTKDALAKTLSAPVKVEEDADFKELTVPDKPTGKAGEPASSPAIAAPNSLSAEVKALWSSLPPKAQEEFARREQQAHAKISEQGNELKAYQPLREVYGFIQQQGVPAGREAEVVRNWAAAQAFLDRKPEDGIRWLAESYGVDLAQLTGQRPQAQQPSADGLEELFRDPRLDKDVLPRFQQVDARVQQLERQLMARQQADADARQSQANDIITKFAVDKPYWSDLFEDVTREVKFLMQANPRAPMEKLLQEGYKRALRTNDTVFERMQADQKHEADVKAEAARKAAEAEKAKQTDKAKKMASINQRTGATASTPMFDGKWDDDAKMGAIFDRITAGR